jgi:Diguanylate cyclase, GGDEF domain
VNSTITAPRRRHDRAGQPATFPVARRNRVGPVSALSAADVAVNARHRSVQIHQRSIRSRRRRPRYRADRRDLPARERKSDVAARFGGEEFLLLLPETQLSQAHELAERLRRQIETRDLSVASHAITATVSIGVAQATSTMDTIFDLIKVAAGWRCHHGCRLVGRAWTALRPQDRDPLRRLIR